MLAGLCLARTGASIRGIWSKFVVFSGPLRPLSEGSESTPIQRGTWTDAKGEGDRGADVAGVASLPVSGDVERCASLALYSARVRGR